MAMTATAAPVDGGLRHRVDVNGRHVIFTDEPERLGGTDTAAAPHELLAAMVAACVSTMIAAYARSRGWELPGLQVEVSYETDTAPRPVILTLHLPPGLDESQLARLRRVADTCPVKRAFESGFAFEQRVLVGGAPTA